MGSKSVPELMTKSYGEQMLTQWDQLFFQSHHKMGWTVPLNSKHPITGGVQVEEE